MSTTPRLTNIDHIHVYVPNRAAAAEWYEKVLGFSVVESLLSWAEDEQGPLTLEDQDGNIHLALFQRETFTPLTSIAFGTDGAQFMEWKHYLESRDLLKRLADHKLAWSMYFYDPYDNMHEITTYEYDDVARQLQQLSS